MHETRIRIMTIDNSYSRADRQLRDEVRQRLFQNEQTAPYGFRIGVLNAIVHLAGEAPSVDIWELAGKIVAQAPGVRGVVNRIAAPGAPEPARTIHISLKPDDHSFQNRQET